MSLNAMELSESALKVPPLRTADQYPAWKVRVADKCWALTGKDIFVVQRDACAAALLAQTKAEAKSADFWVNKCWLTITAALHDDLLVKVAHVERGNIPGLLAELGLPLWSTPLRRSKLYDWSCMAHPVVRQDPRNTLGFAHLGFDASHELGPDVHPL